MTMACKLSPAFPPSSLAARRAGSFGVRAEGRDVTVGWFRVAGAGWGPGAH
jgi:hypothetical protein